MGACRVRTQRAAQDMRRYTQKGWALSALRARARGASSTSSCENHSRADETAVESQRFKAPVIIVYYALPSASGGTIGGNCGERPERHVCGHAHAKPTPPVAGGRRSAFFCVKGTGGRRRGDTRVTQDGHVPGMV